MSERDILLLTLLFWTAVWAISATLIAVHLTGRRSFIRWIIEDVRRTFRREE
ncbi:hypothetical protein [Shinella sp. BYT-45]|uniref:hypothetical protein n=1 Tax=Shinella sp. BYT-45 TaxID=3377377 RepID=UPI00398055D7